MKKIFPRLGLISLALLFTVFLIVGNSIIYNQQRTGYINAFKLTQQTDIKLLSQLAREGLISKNYALIEWFFNTFALDYKKVVSLKLENQNGFALSRYQRRLAAEGETITDTKTLQLHDGNYTISMVSDMTEIDNELEQLKLLLILVNSGATLLAILNFWFLFKHFTIRHLQQEKRLRRNAEEKLKRLEDNT